MATIDILENVKQNGVEISIKGKDADKRIYELLRQRGYVFNKLSKKWFKSDPKGIEYDKISHAIDSGTYKKLKVPKKTTLAKEKTNPKKGEQLTMELSGIQTGFIKIPLKYKGLTRERIKVKIKEVYTEFQGRIAVNLGLNSEVRFHAVGKRKVVGSGLLSHQYLSVIELLPELIEAGNLYNTDKPKANHIKMYKDAKFVHNLYTKIKFDGDTNISLVKLTLIEVTTKNVHYFAFPITAGKIVEIVKEKKRVEQFSPTSIKTSHSVQPSYTSNIQNPTKKDTTSQKKSLDGVMSLEDVATTEYKTIGLDGQWRELIGDACHPTKILVTGKGGTGKSGSVLKFSEYLTKKGFSVLYVAGEQFGTPTFKELIKAVKLDIKNPNITIVDSLERRNPADYDLVVIDSKDSLKMTTEDFRTLDKQFGNNTSFIVLSQATKNGEFRGSGEWQNEIDTMLTATEKGVLETGVKNRWGGSGRVVMFEDNKGG